MAKKQGKRASQVFKNGAGKIADYEYAVLRSEYSNRRNSTLQYAATKLGVVDPAAANWEIQRSYDVVIPLGTSDAFADPRALWAAYEAARLPQQRDLALVLTLWTPDLTTMHDRLEAARTWAYAAFARRRRLPAMVVAHNPLAAGVRHDPHVHVMVAARELGSLGFEAFSDLCRDEPLKTLHADWSAHLRAWVREGRS